MYIYLYTTISTTLDLELELSFKAFITAIESFRIFARMILTYTPTYTYVAM